MPTRRTREVPWSSSDRLVARAVAQPVQQFLHTEAASGIVLAACAVVALVWANSPWSGGYETLWTTEITIGVGSFHITEDLQHWVNDLAMALFFFVAGLEIKRELIHGQLRSVRDATLPIACAVGGMVVPALIYLAFNAADPETAMGWGVPMVTDIAFSIGVLALVGRRAPVSLKVFMLTLAIVDDIGAVIVIAVVYSDGIRLGWLAGAVVAVVAIVALQRSQVRWLAPYIVLAVVLWLAVFESGMHATIAGIVLGLLTPAHPFHHPARVHAAVTERLATGAGNPVADGLADDVAEEIDEVAFIDVVAVATEGVSPLARLEHRLHPWSSFVVLPLFALANAGISFSAGGGFDLTSGVTLGIVAGLVVGKPLGVLVAALLATRALGARLPEHVGWLELAGAALLAGIGFTVSLFVAGLAFDPPLADRAKLAVLAASCVAGVLGAGLLLARPTPDPLTASTG